MPSPGGLVIPGDKEFRFSASEVNKLHAYDDVDSNADSHHHTLGTLPYQAAPGSIAADSGWLPMTPLQGTWAVYEAGGATWAEPAYRKVGKRVQLRGLIKNGATTGQIFNALPAAYRPTKTHLFYVPSNTSLLRVDVQPDGIIYANGFLIGADTAWTSLFPISYFVG